MTEERRNYMKIKKIVCPSCGKELIELDITAKERNVFWCDDCNINFEIFDEDTMVIYNDNIMAEWTNPAKEEGRDFYGLGPLPESEQYLKFDVLHNIGTIGDDFLWEEMKDASGTTEITADMTLEEKLSGLWIIFRAYREVLREYRMGYSVKRLKGYLRWLGMED